MGGILAPKGLKDVTISFDGTLIYNDNMDIWPRTGEGKKAGEEKEGGGGDEERSEVTIHEKAARGDMARRGATRRLTNSAASTATRGERSL